MKFIVYAVSLALLAGSQFSFAASRIDQSRRDQQCLALAMYWEARGEGAAGMLAVGFVVKNRAAHQNDFPDRSSLSRSYKQDQHGSPGRSDEANRRANTVS